MIQKLKRLLGIENYEEALRSFAVVLEEERILKSEIDLMSKTYSESSNELSRWLKSEEKSEVQDLIKSQQNSLTSRYLSSISSNRERYLQIEKSKRSFIEKYPHFEKALVELKRSDLIQKTLSSYRDNQLSLLECDTIIKSATGGKVKYSDNLVFNEKGDILIVQRSPLDTNGPNLWVLPGGHVEVGEDHCSAAKRELFEETGYKVDECIKVGELEDKTCYIEYFQSTINTKEQSPTLEANESRYSEFVPIKDLYKYPTMYNMWDSVYRIFGIEEHVVKIKKSISLGLVKSFSTESLLDRRIEKSIKEKLYGGDADGKSIEDIAKKHKVSVKKIAEEYEVGYEEEKEHTKDEKERCEIVKDHLMKDPNYYTKLKTIEKSEETELQKAKQLGHLIPKKVQIKSKDGKIHMAIRWVSAETGESEKHAVGLKENKIIVGETFESSVEAIASSDLPKSDKVRNLIDLGIYDTKLLTLLTGEPTPQYFLKQADIDSSSLPDNSETIIKEVRREQADNDTPQERETNKFLARKPEDIAELWDNYERNLKRVATGRHKFAIAYGTGGVGKSFTFEQLAKSFELREFDDEVQPSKDQYDYVVIKGRISPVQVYAEMYRHRDKLIVFDDCDSFLATEDVQGFLKAGLDTGEGSKISNKSSKKVYQIEGDPESGVIPNTFSFKGRVIAITNLTSRQIDQAVKSRALCSNLTMTTDETILKLSTIKDRIKILTADKSSVIEVTQEARDYAFEVLQEQKEKLGGDINTRTFSNAVLMAHDALEEGVPKDKVRREIVAYFDSVTGHFDEMIRKQKGK